MPVALLGRYVFPANLTFCAVIVYVPAASSGSVVVLRSVREKPVLALLLCFGPVTLAVGTAPAGNPARMTMREFFGFAGACGGIALAAGTLVVRHTAPIAMALARRISAAGDGRRETWARTGRDADREDSQAMTVRRRRTCAGFAAVPTRSGWLRHRLSMLGLPLGQLLLQRPHQLP
ncbi:MAG: hypothetical protein EB098_08295, partial [Betaproteobacteria bacterium]|nr:hypothetical protein [Betaproteobacteria bacterium]